MTSGEKSRAGEAEAASAVSVALVGQRGAFRLDAAFDAPGRGITALFGPSGSGKTTILRCIAGLEKMPGRIVVGGETWQDTTTGVFRPPYLRRTGYVFQESNLFAHLSVRDNLLFGARRVNAPAARGRTDPSRLDSERLDFDGTVDLLGLRVLLDRSPAALSGGERQRVAVGRALLAQPDLLLMDEPLSALDRPTKDEILQYFETLHATLALPILYITHDLGEVERLADTLVMVDDGRVVASGPLAALQTDPRLPLLAGGDASVVLDGIILANDATFDVTRFAVAGGELLAPGIQGAVGATRRLRIAASDVSIARSAAHDSTILNCLRACILSIEGHPGAPHVTAILGLGADGMGCRIAARFSRRSLVHLALAPGDAVFAQIKGVALVSSRAAKDARTGQ